MGKVAKKSGEPKVQSSVQPCTLKTESGKEVAVLQVTVSSGVTLNMGEYESARFDVGIALAAMDKQSVEEVTDAGWSYVMSELGKMIKDARENASKKKSKGRDNG